MHYRINMLRDIILAQKRELENRFEETYVERKIPLPLEFRNDLIHVITGPRRAGKTFYAIHLIKQTASYGYVNFDDERLMITEDYYGIINYNEIIDAVNTVYNNPRYLLLDEIQNLPCWEIFVNRLQQQGHCLLITSSNADLLSSELVIFLTGIRTSLVLFPFSFAEFLKMSGGEQTESGKKAVLDIYVEQVGYPEPLLNKKIDRHSYLRTLLQSTLNKDIVKQYRIKSFQGLENLALYLMSNIAGEYSYKALVGVTTCRSAHTIDKYIRHLQEVYLVFTIPRFSFKTKDQAGRTKKIYCTDNGLAISAGFRFSPDRGALYENLVAIALQKEAIAGQRISLFYWKSAQNEEVNFVVREGHDITRLIQVCSDTSNPKTLMLKMRALIKASQELHCDELLLLNDRFDGTQMFNWQNGEPPVKLMPLYKWLVE